MNSHSKHTKGRTNDEANSDCHRRIKRNGKGDGDSFGTRGWNVVITGRTEETLETTANEIKQQGGSIAYFPMDVRHPEDADQMVKFAVDTFGDVDALINNAAGNF